MKTVGEILHQARKEQNISLEEVSNITKISVDYLKAIEKNDFASLPPSAFTKGFMQNYAKVVRLNPKNLLAIFRRDYDQDEKGRIIPRGLTESSSSSRDYFNPTTMSIALSFIVGLLIAGFFVRQIIVFNSAPKIQIITPEEYSHLSSPITIQGTTDPQATITINNRPTSVNQTGEFTAQITLTPGEHTLVIVATSRSDKSRTIQRVIHIDE